MNSKDGAESAVKEITEAGGSTFAMKGDMTKSADVKALVKATQDKLSPVIDILVSVTGGMVERKKITDMDEAHWHKVMNLNTTSYFLLVQAAVPHMKNGGAIVGLASQAGRDGGGPGAVPYGASKGAVMTMTRGLAKELAPDIRVNSVCPGMIDTDFHNNFTKPEVRAHVANITPLKREGVAMDVANLVAYLASDEAAFITGANVDINGGMLFS
jgi:3-oxoacyl-[acyl-carrier protein] reductase